ncbi:MAG: hypothetical protein MR894_00710 [Akkermansia muciniphila]|nr:hypothetical protein [Akkermansia muciniphila]
MAKLKTGSQAKLPTLGGSVSAGALTRAGAAGKTARPARAAAAKSSAGAAAPMWMRKAAMVGKAMNGGAKMSRNTGMRGDNAPEEELPAETEAFVDEIPAPPPLPTEPVEPAKTEPFAAAPAEPVPAPPPLPSEPVEPSKTEPFAAAPAEPVPAPPPLPTEPVEPAKAEPFAAAPAEPVPAPPPLPSEPVEPTKTEPIPIPVAAAEPAKTTKAEQPAAKATTAPLRKPKAGDASPLLQAVPVEHEDSSGLSMFTLVVIVLLGFYLGLLMHHWQKVGEFSFFPGMPHLPG